MLKETQESQNKVDNVNHPAHYTFGTIETIEYIHSTLGNEGCYDYCIGNALKYISRAKHKGKWSEDIKKSQWYLNYALTLIDQIEKEKQKNI